VVISARQLLAVALAAPVLAALATLSACDALLGLGELKDRVADGSAEGGVDAPDVGRPDALSDGSTDGGPDGGVVVAKSCYDAGGPGLSDCGPDGGESCCASLLVVGGTFNRSKSVTDPYPATVNNFGLDRFEVTVGRFRVFVNAVSGGWLPTAGSGKHTHLNGGQGLAATAGGNEPGWDVAWNGNLAGTQIGWTTNLSCNGTYQTWTGSAGANESRPIVCATWFEASAFCIWDGGFLPSEAEGSYAAAGGSEQREYPWSNPPSSTTIDCTFANYGGSSWPSTACVPIGSNKVGSEARGDGRWGQADLAGNVWEWNADWYSGYGNQCINCANVTTSSGRVIRGGGFGGPAPLLLASSRLAEGLSPTSRSYFVGLRCARTP